MVVYTHRTLSVDMCDICFKSVAQTEKEKHGCISIYMVNRYNNTSFNLSHVSIIIHIRIHNIHLHSLTGFRSLLTTLSFYMTRLKAIFYRSCI